MSGSATLGLEQQLLGHSLAFAPMVAPAQVWVALDLAPPAASPSEAAPGTEVSGGGYVRMPATFALVATPANIAANTTSIEFPYATTAWGTIGYFELWDSSIGGNRLYWGQLIDPATELTTVVTVTAGNILRFSPGALGVQAATGSGGTSSVGAYLPLGGGQMQGSLLLYSDPMGPTEAATKAYVDAHSGTGGGTGYLPISGGSLTGALTLVGDAAAALQPVTLQQVNSASVGGPFLPVTGGVVATGSTASISLQNRFAAAWNLKDFGAVSDGTTDDSAAINAAIAAINGLPHGGKLVLPAGRTVVASAIVASIPAGVSLTIEGMGPQASELYFSGATNGLSFTLRNSGNAWGAVSLHGFTVTRGPTSPTMANTGINIIGDPAVAKQCSPRMSFRDLLIQGSGGAALSNQWTNGMILNGISAYTVDNVTILAMNATATDQGDACLTVNGPSSPHFATSCNFANCMFQGGTVGLLITGYVQGVFVVNCSIIGQYDGIRWSGGFNDEELAVSNSTFNAGNRGIYVTQVNTVSVTGSDILHLGTGMTSAWAGIELNQSSYNNIVGNLITCSHLSTAEYGVILSGVSGPCYTVVVGNVCINMLTGHAVWVEGATTGAVVIGNSQLGSSQPVTVQDTPTNLVLGNTWNGLESTPLNTGQPMVFHNPTTGIARWFVGNDASTESGGDTGSNFEIVSSHDNGALNVGVSRINRATGGITIGVVPASYTNDAAAATAGVPVGGIYRNGSALQVRVT